MPLPPPLRRLNEDGVSLFHEPIASAHVLQLRVLGTGVRRSEAVAGAIDAVRELTCHGQSSRDRPQSRVRGREGIPGEHEGCQWGIIGIDRKEFIWHLRRELEKHSSECHLSISQFRAVHAAV